MKCDFSYSCAAADKILTELRARTVFLRQLSYFVCLFVCLSVTLLNVRVCVSDFVMKALEYRNYLIPLDRGRFVIVHLCSTF